VHASNRQYAVYIPEENIAFLKCHDDEAKGKKISLVLPELVRSPEEMKSMLPQNFSEYSCESDDDLPEMKSSEAVYNAPNDEAEVKLLNSAHTDADYSEYFMKCYPNRFVMFSNSLYEFKPNAHTWTRLDDNNTIFLMLENEVFKTLRECLNRVLSGLEDASKHALITKHLLKLRNWNSRKGIVSSIALRRKWPFRPTHLTTFLTSSGLRMAFMIYSKWSFGPVCPLIMSADAPTMSTNPVMKQKSIS
jgi:hypothetical protein